MAPIMSMCTAEQSGGIVMVSQGRRGEDSKVPVPLDEFRGNLCSPGSVKSSYSHSCFLDLILPSSSVCDLTHSTIF